ncbi:hypothetical protein ACRARG_14960 [Pseudooceanicola sp. C21-150M6]|uniref:hypothetical protein n=1 Tax=Pseudooceanicola sp. C21-150M6 TaxID=3434355 RepID=UPI003D7F6EF2
MHVTLHLGAHRTANMSFHYYLRANRAALQRRGVGVWDRRQTRGGMFAGIDPRMGSISRQHQFDLARRRIGTALHGAAKAGVRHLIVSDGTLLGPMAHNRGSSRLYPCAGDWVGRYLAAFDGAVDRLTLTLRSQDTFWTSAMAAAICQGADLPTKDALSGLVADTRGWSDVVRDVAGAAGRARLTVLTHESIANLPERRLFHMTGGAVHGPAKSARAHLNAAPDAAMMRRMIWDRGNAVAAVHMARGDEWSVFDATQAARLRSQYRSDLDWLGTGAEGLADLALSPWTPAGAGRDRAAHTRPDRVAPVLGRGKHISWFGKAGPTPPDVLTGRGTHHGIEEGRLARSR